MQWRPIKAAAAPVIATELTYDWTTLNLNTDGMSVKEHPRLPVVQVLRIMREAMYIIHLMQLVSRVT